MRDIPEFALLLSKEQADSVEISLVGRKNILVGMNRAHVFARNACLFKEDMEGVTKIETEMAKHDREIEIINSMLASFAADCGSAGGRSSGS